MTTVVIPNTRLLKSIDVGSGQWVRVDGVIESKPSISLCEPDAQWGMDFIRTLRSSAKNMLEEECADALFNTFRCFTVVCSLQEGLSGLVKAPSIILTGLLVMKDSFDLKTYSIFGGYVEQFLDGTQSFQLNAGIGNTKEPVMLLNIAVNKHNNMECSYV